MDPGPIVCPAFASTWHLPTSPKLPTSLPLAPVTVFRKSTVFVAVHELAFVTVALTWNLALCPGHSRAFHVDSILSKLKTGTSGLMSSLGRPQMIPVNMRERSPTPTGVSLLGLDVITFSFSYY